MIISALASGVVDERSNLGVVVPAGELLGTHANGKDGNCRCRVAVTRPAQHGIAVENLVCLVTKIVDVLVECLDGGAAAHDVPVSSPQFGILVVSDRYLRVEPEIVGKEGAYLLPTEAFAVLLLEFGKAVGENPFGALLVLKRLQVEGVVAVAECHAARLVVGCDDDEGLVGMLLVESIGEVQGFVHVDGLADGGGSVASVAGVVNLAALDHHEETVAVAELGDGGLNDLGEGEVAVGTVDGIRNGLAFEGSVGGVLGGHENHLVGTEEPLGLVVTARDGVAVGFAEVIEVGCGGIVLVDGFVEARAAEEIEAGGCQLGADIVVVIALGGMCVVGGRGGMVDSHGGHDANSPALALEACSDTLHGLAIGCDANHAVVGLLARGKACAGGCGVSDAVGGRESGDLSGVGERGHQQLVTPDSPAQFGEVHLGGKDLVGTHAVADKEEYILGLRKDRDREARCDEKRYKNTFHRYGI